jgi:RHS repeat-associated protein
VKVSGGTPGTVLYWYDEAGHLLGEYSSTGALVEETIWMGDIPVATIRPGTPAVVYYVHTDHLNTPRRVTRPSDNKLMWTWYADPFGSELPNENPAGGGTFKYNLRFPGQLYDSHAGLSQNYFRDYDPAIGRYVESDPIGLRGGSYSTFAHVLGNPISASDPSGLLVRGGGWGDGEWQEIQNAEAKIRQELANGCSCHRNSSVDSCMPCNLIPALLNRLDTMGVAYAPLLVRNPKTGKLIPQCGFTPPVEQPRDLFLSRVPFGKVPGRSCKPGCLASTLYHELLHASGLVFDVPTATEPPAAVLEGECIGHLCERSSP